MLLKKYFKKYLVANGQLSVLGLGTFNLLQINWDSYEVLFTHNATIPTDAHFIEIISKEQKSDFENIQKQLDEDSVFIKNLLNEGELVQIEGVGSLKFINNRITFFSEKL